MIAESQDHAGNGSLPMLGQIERQAAAMALRWNVSDGFGIDSTI